MFMNWTSCTKTWTPRWDSRMKRLSVDCTTLRPLALTTPPTALESRDAGLTPDWRRQKRSSRFEREFLCISSLEVRLALPLVLWGVWTAAFERSCRISLTRRILFGPESTIKRLSWYVIILLCQIIYGALDTQILLIKYCDYLSMSNNLYGARETNIVLIVLYTLWLCDHFPYPYGFLILYGSTEINDMIYAHKVNTREELLQLILSAARSINNATVLRKVTISLVTLVRKCTQADGGHFEKFASVLNNQSVTVHLTT